MTIKGNANQNHFKISPHSHQNGYQVLEDAEKKEPSYPVGGNVN
jgi:hypothetical protein